VRPRRRYAHVAVVEPAHPPSDQTVPANAEMWSDGSLKAIEAPGEGAPDRIGPS
jgi:hypothetical protein